MVLIGFMGAGKSLIASQLSKKLRKEVVETDRLIELKENRTISDIFKDLGEPYFRKVEKQIVFEVSKRRNIIIDCGGGTVLDEESRQNLKKSGTLIYLSALPETIFDRIKHQGQRPLLGDNMSVERITVLLKQRKPIYEQAHFTVDTSYKTPQQIVEEILKVVKR